MMIHEYVFLPEFKKTLEEAIKSDTSGHFQRLLISLSQVHAYREFGGGVCVCFIGWVVCFLKNKT